MKTKLSLLKFSKACLILFAFSCKQGAIEYDANECKAQPTFIKQIGFNPLQSALSTSEKRMMGLVLLQFNQKGDTSNGGKKIYQHPSWKSAGWLGAIQLDPQGNCFVAPVPVINLIDNPPAKQNIIYKVDALSGEMKPFVELPLPDSISSTNPYGILGFSYLCQTNTLFVSTVLGSTRQIEKGVIYAIDANDGKILDKIINTDAMGLGISYISEQRRLYFGSTRASEVYSININNKGKFEGKPSLEFSIANIGPRGDDKVRRIKFDKAGNMQLAAVEFNYNLTAPTEKQESIYTFSWDDEQKKWLFLY